MRKIDDDEEEEEEEDDDDDDDDDDDESLPFSGGRGVENVSYIFWTFETLKM